jgi:hypothetical protein
MKNSIACRMANRSAVFPGTNLLRREKIDTVQRGDDFTAHEQLLQIVAIAELVIAKKTDPEIPGRNRGFAGFEKGRRNEHADFLSTARATLSAPWAQRRSITEMKSGVADGTRTRNSQNHNLELYH